MGAELFATVFDWFKVVLTRGLVNLTMGLGWPLVPGDHGTGSRRFWLVLLNWER